MTNKEKKEWLSVKYPLTIICDRYGGTYSGAMWLAFPLGRDEVPEDVDGEDSECMYFWKNYQEPVGKGVYANDAVVDLIQQMRQFEPEESEDERIREKMVRCLTLLKKEGREFFGSEPIDNCITYLEKQKEQKPADLPAGFYFIDQDGNKYYSKEFRFNNGTFTTTMKVKEEQKPSWSEEDERNIRNLESVLYYAKDLPDETHTELGNFLKSLSPQPKQEWSEEDEKMIERLITRLNWITYNTRTDGTSPNITFLEEIDWLKSLRQQPRKEIYQAAKHDLAIKFMNYLDENRPEEKMSLSNGECEDIDKAFKENDWAKIIRYIEKYSSHNSRN